MEGCDREMNSFFDVQVDVVAHPQRFESSLLSLEASVPTSDFTTTTENIFRSNIETIRTIGNILFVETVSSFYDNRSRYKSTVVEAFLQHAMSALQEYDSLRDFDSPSYLFISQALLRNLRKDFDHCKLMMKVTDKDLEVFNLQHQKFLEQTNENVTEEVLKISRDNLQRKERLQQAREEGRSHGL